MSVCQGRVAKIPGFPTGRKGRRVTPLTIAGGQIRCLGSGLCRLTTFSTRATMLIAKHQADWKTGHCRLTCPPSHQGRRNPTRLRTRLSDPARCRRTNLSRHLKKSSCMMQSVVELVQCPSQRVQKRSARVQEVMGLLAYTGTTRSTTRQYPARVSPSSEDNCHHRFCTRLHC